MESSITPFSTTAAIARASEQIAPADPRLDRGEPAWPHVMDRCHQTPGDRDQGGEAEVHRQHADRQFEREGLGKVVPVRAGCQPSLPRTGSQEPGSRLW